MKVDHRHKPKLKVRSRRKCREKNCDFGLGRVRCVIKCTKRKKKAVKHIQKIKKLVLQKSSFRKQEDNPQIDEKKIFANHTSDKELITYFKNFI